MIDDETNELYQFNRVNDDDIFGLHEYGGNCLITGT